MRKRKTTTLSEIPYFQKLMQSLQIIPQYYISKLSYNLTLLISYASSCLKWTSKLALHSIILQRQSQLLRPLLQTLLSLGKLLILIKRGSILSVNNSVLVASEFELLTLRRKVFLLHIYNLILVILQAILELQIPILWSILFPIIEQL